MKGIELPTNIMIIIALAVIALVVIGFFILSQGGRQQQLTNANEVFSLACESYRESGCEWSSTRTASFNNFVSACQVLFGDENRAYSCLYNYCCARSSAARCDGMCALCKGNDYSGIGLDSVESCLALYSNECSEPCDV